MTDEEFIEFLLQQLYGYIQGDDNMDFDTLEKELNRRGRKLEDVFPY
jgi:hypothetical protein